jgi:eukaryotic-like serine/threonine-protein kinase
MAETTQFGDQDDGLVKGTLKVNTILMTRYRIIGVLGGGGQGAVYQGRDLNFPDAKRLVAVKEMLYPSGDPNVRASTLETFRREANILATLDHPSIPKIFDFFDQDDRAYLVMEHVNGSDLELLLGKTKELPMEKILEWAIDLCDVLHYLHNHQPEPIIFRDVKPANIMIDHLGKSRLIDFGIAKIFASGVKHTMIGTEGYSAPEQYRGDVSPLSDVYALGASLHHIITRKDPRLEPPFSFAERPLSKFNSDAPEAMDAIINKSLEMNPQDRFQSCTEMKAALEQVRYGSETGTAIHKRRVDSFGVSTSNFPEEATTFGTIEPRWVFKSEDEIRSSPTVYEKMVFVGSYDTNVWALDMDSGELRWKYATRGGIASSPIVDDYSNLVLFGSEDQSFHAVEVHSGYEKWTHQTDGRIRSAPALAQGHVFFGSDDGRLYALRSGNGHLIWDFSVGAPIRGKPAVTDDVVIFGSEDGDLVALELSGDRKWAHSLKRAFTASPLVDESENICYIGSFDGYMYAYDSTNGYSMWRFRTNGPIVSSVALENSTIYFGSADGNLYALNAENAREKWHFSIEKPIVAAPVVHGDYLYFGGTDGMLYCLDVKNGAELWRFATKNAITAAPYITDNYIFVGSMDQNLYALPLVTA